jgi:hypothetical protein
LQFHAVVAVDFAVAIALRSPSSGKILVAFTVAVESRAAVTHGVCGEWGSTMFYMAALLAMMTGLFYAAGNGEMAGFGASLCQYGEPFCQHPTYALAASALAAIWGAFVSIR